MSVPHAPGELLVDGEWRPGRGAAFTSKNGVTGDVAWSGAAATDADVDLAVRAARAAIPAWRELPFEERRAVIERFGRVLGDAAGAIAIAIGRETGKPLWEAKTEVASMIAKLPIAVRAHEERLRDRAESTNGVRRATRHRPHGVLAVFGPYNFPGHLPNGHIVPALLAGNTVVFKPSERTPGVAAMTAILWQAAGLPAGVLNLVQGMGDVGAALAGHAGVDGVLFTGSARVGALLHAQMAGQPQKILALEMGGNNPLVVGTVADERAAVVHTLQSAFASAGQRCTCARRLIVRAGAEGDRFLDALVRAAAALRAGAWNDAPPPFMGGLIDVRAGDELLAVQDALLDRGATALLAMRRLRPGTSLLSPGILDVTRARDVPDEEHFGPLLKVHRYRDFAEAIAIANATRFGLAAGLLSDDAREYAQFFRDARAGVVNWNQPLTGASSTAPFGGVGASGNHRPAAYYAADACAYPVASIEVERCAVPETLPPGLDSAA